MVKIIDGVVEDTIVVSVSGQPVQISGQFVHTDISGVSVAVSVSGQTVITRYEDVNTTILNKVLIELKKINIQLALITDNEIKEYDVEV